LKILVNRLRAYEADEDITEPSEPVFKFLNTLVQKRGQLSQKQASPKSHQSQLRLLAAQLLLKLCCEGRFNALFTPTAFNELACIVQDPCGPVRSGFVDKLMKYLGQNKLSKRFYAYLFLLAFEPVTKTKDRAVTWLRSRALQFAKAKDTAMEALFARLLSLLAWHPDFESGEEDREQNMRDFATYIVFYLQTVATQDNLSLIYHVAQRVKSVLDGIDESKSENLYVLSDLAQAVIRKYEELRGWQLQVWPGKVGMPSGIFKAMPGHYRAQAVAMKSYVSADVIDSLDDVVKSALRVKKRKMGDENRTPKAKKIKAEKVEPKEKKERKIKTPKKRLTSDAGMESGERRRSGRAAASKSYVEQSSDEDDAEMEQWDRGKDDEAMSNEKATGAAAEPSSETALPEEEDEIERTPVRVKKEVPTRATRKAVKASPKQAKTGAKANGFSKLTPKSSPKATRSTRGKGKANGVKKVDIYEISSDQSSDVEMSDA